MHRWCSVIHGASPVAVAAVGVGGGHRHGQAGAQRAQRRHGAGVHGAVGVRGVGDAGRQQRHGRVAARARVIQIYSMSEKVIAVVSCYLKLCLFISQSIKD